MLGGDILTGVLVQGIRPYHVRSPPQQALVISVIFVRILLQQDATTKYDGRIPFL